MNFKIKTATEFDFDFILSLNQKAMPAVSDLNLEKIKYLFHISSYCKILEIDHNPVAFLIGLMPNKPYSSENYNWINNRYNSFMYIDRIIIDVNYRKSGLGTYFYDNLIKSLQKKVVNVLCEVNIKPYNKQSINFHKKYGFKEVGQQDTENGEKRVSFLLYNIIS